MHPLSDEDRRDAESRGLGAAEIVRQLELLRHPPDPIRLVRACTPGDGVRILEDAEQDACLTAHARAEAQGRLTYFCPASGAATRMFKALAGLHAAHADATRAAVEAAAAQGDGSAREVVTFLDGLDRLALAAEIEDVLRRRGLDLAELRARGTVAPILGAVLDPDGLSCESRPKGLLPFHRYADGERTAFEEHLVDAALYARRGSDAARLHFTVSPPHRAAFEAHLGDTRTRHERRLGVRYEVGFSTQSPATDTVAVDAAGEPFRDARGKLLFRPGGHGALLHNLAGLSAAGADLVYVKNIDNVVPEHRKPVVVRWKKILAGHLIRLAAKAYEARRALASEPLAAGFIAAAGTLLRDALNVALPESLDSRSLGEQREILLGLLDRPIRVCGVVRCEGDPGGAPFWVRDADGGISAQIVETAQIDLSSPEQRDVQRAATHFNPVDLVCSLRDADGRAYDLREFVDPNAVFITEKSSGGRALKALEHPGLWNGAMARWITVFVEVPPATFNPVKTINDLLLPEHQPDDEARA